MSANRFLPKPGKVRSTGSTRRDGPALYSDAPPAYDALMLIGRHRGKPGKGRVLAIKWGLNPNSSSLGVDVTFLLFGATALSLVTPVVSALVRLRIAKASKVDSNETTSS